MLEELWLWFGVACVNVATAAILGQLSVPLTIASLFLLNRQMFLLCNDWFVWWLLHVCKFKMFRVMHSLCCASLCL